MELAAAHPVEAEGETAAISAASSGSAMNGLSALTIRKLEAASLCRLLIL